MRTGAIVKQRDAEPPRPRVVVRYRGFAARAEGYGCGGGGAACLHPNVLYQTSKYYLEVLLASKYLVEERGN